MPPHWGLRVWGLGFRVQGLVFRVQGVADVGARSEGVASFGGGLRFGFSALGLCAYNPTYSYP